MLKSKTAKIIIGAIIVLCVLAASSIWVFSSMKKNSVDEFGYSQLAPNGSSSTTMTQIDHIIENSNTVEEGSDPNYNVVIITNGVTDASEVVKNFFLDDTVGVGFSDVVVNDNRTISATMPNGKMRMNVKTVGELNGLDKDGIAAAMGNVDLIYLYASTSTAYAGDTAISENLYEYLHNYAFGSNKPLIMSYGLANTGEGDDTQGGGDTGSGYDSQAFFMTSVDFKNSWRRTRTTMMENWKNTPDADAEAVIKSYIGTRRTLYSVYEVNRLTKPDGYATWQDYWSRNDGTSTLNILYIYGESMEDDTGIVNAANWMLSDEGKGWAFSGLSSDLPQNVAVTSKKGSELKPEDFYVATESGDASDVKKYDYIFIAPSDYKPLDDPADPSTGSDISPEVRATLNTLSESTKQEGLTYILFGALEGRTQTSSGNTGGSSSVTENLTFDTNTNFGKLLDLSVTTTGYAKKGNVLVVGTQFMDTMATNPSMNPKKVAKIVALINKSTFRTHAGSSSGGTSGSVSTTAYRVLELQPCYPIDKVLASTITDKYGSGDRTLSKYTNAVGNYYTIPADVLNSSEIDDYMSEDEQGNLRMTQEYYQWDLSKAKLAYALGMKSDQIELVQMSTDEYITAKADASDSYDLIYIGGNMSAFKNNLAYGYDTPDHSIVESRRNYEAVFSMYCHTGELTQVQGQRLNAVGDYVLMNGNDITFDRLTQLKAYIDAGMPVVFSNEIWNAYDLAKKFGYKNRYMDPDCNMFKLCAYAEEAAKTKESVLVNWENRQPYEVQGSFFTDYYVAKDEMTIPNADGVYGAAAKVTVYSEYLSNRLYDCVNSEQTSVRPKFKIDTTALTYVEGDTKTELTGRDVSWKIELLNPLEGHTYQAVLLQDVDDNAVFDLNDSEELISKPQEFSADNTAELTYTYPDDDFGAFSWKVVVQDTTTKASTGYSAITCFAKLEDQPKKQASILEIMPMLASHCNSSNPTGPDGHTFYLDKNYQQSSGNPYLYSTYGTNKGKEYGYCPILHSPGNGLSDAQAFNNNQIARATVDGNYQGLSDVNMGKYMTNLSVNRYDSGEGHEDRDYNYMDLVSDEYDFSLDIMYMDDIIYYSKVAHDSSITDDQRKGYAEEAEKAKELYDAYKTEGTPEYERLKLVEDALREALISIRDGNNYTGTFREIRREWGPNGPVEKEVDATYTVPNSEFKKYGIDQMLQSRDYFRFFYLNTDVYHDSGWAHSAYVVYASVYKPYIDEHDKMVDAYRKYRHYNMMAYGPKEYLRKNYDVIVVGFFDDYQGGFQDFSEVETEDLLAFTDYKEVVNGKTYEDGGSLLMTHDNMTYAPGDGHAVNLTAKMRSVMGMEPFANLKAVESTGTTGYQKYTSTNARKYFLSNLSSNPDMNFAMASPLQGAAWDTAFSGWVSGANRGVTKDHNVNLIGYTDVFNVYRTGHGYTQRYTFAEFETERAIEYNMQISGPLKNTGTAKATQVNRGVVTTYPFYIASDLRISNTHSQAYALDMEDSAVTVWYTLAADSTSEAGTAGGTNYTTMKENSSMYAASPRDGGDSYYIYSVGNITYCGAGHALITGDQRDNNDERRLFLNVLINMAKKTRKQQKEADIILYDPDGTTKAPGNVVKRDAENGYHIDVTSAITYPEFGFKVDLLSGQSATDVKLFYDLDYKAGMENPDAYVDNDNHVLVPLPDTEDILKALNENTVRVFTKLNYPGLVTKREYFDKYGGKYTYLVVSVTLSDGTVLTKRIKIMLTNDLLDLT